MSERFFRIQPRPDEQYWEWHQSFIVVLECYGDVIHLPPISGLMLDEDGDVVKQKTLLPGSAALHFKCDVEKITARILRDHPDLQSAWFKAVEGEPIPARVEQRLVKLLGPSYRPLRPSVYFKPSLRGATCAA